MPDQADKLRQLIGDSSLSPSSSPRNLNNVLSFASGKGGVGKSSIAVNLALALHSRHFHTLIFDADLGMANVNLFLGDLPSHSVFDLLHGSNPLDIINHSELGVDFISASSSLGSPVSLDDSQRSSLLSSLSPLLRSYDYIIIDNGAGINPFILDCSTAASLSFIVTTPDPPAISDAFSIIKSLAPLSPNLALIVNRADDAADASHTFKDLSSASEIISNFHLQDAGYIFEDSIVRKAARYQVPFFLSDPNCPASKCVRSLAEFVISGNLSPVNLGFLHFFKSLFK